VLLFNIYVEYPSQFAIPKEQADRDIPYKTKSELRIPRHLITLGLFTNLK